MDGDSPVSDYNPLKYSGVSGAGALSNFTMIVLLSGAWERWANLWPHLVTILDVTLALAASSHAVLYKRDARAAVAWVGFIWLVPFLGTLLYVLLGVNRIRRRARSLRAGYLSPEPSPNPFACDISEIPSLLGREFAQLTALARVVAEATNRQLLRGNRITPLRNGDEAYSAMIQAVDEANDSVLLSTYIFDNDRAGGLFVEAFRRAAARHVAVRLLIDDVGARYSWPSALQALAQTGARVALFLPTLIPTRFRFANLRNHRKIMVVDGRVGFTGAMNIREGCLLELQPKHPLQDLHFRVEGPAVAHLQEVLAEDWAFATGEWLQGERWFPALEPVGETLARGIADGPDENFERLRLTLLGAITCARSAITIVTPYFLPDAALITTLNVAAMRGVEVNILLPAENNLPVVQWAATAQLWQVLEWGCRVWLTPPHSITRS